MSKLAFTQNFLSLFTTADRSASIVGDLAEESRTRGVGWFWLQVARTGLALCFRSVSSAPIRSLLLAPSGIALSEALYIGALRLTGLDEFVRSYDPSQLTVELFLSKISIWIFAIAFLVTANLVVGLGLGRWASTKTMNGCVPAVTLLLVYLAVWPFLAAFVFHLPVTLNIAGAVAAPFVYIAPLLAGGTIGRWRTTT
jgi:hypothetical protein